MDNDHHPPLLGMSIKDTCDMLGVGRTLVYKMLADGRLAGRKVGGRTIVLAHTVHSMLMGRPHQNKVRECLRAGVAIAEREIKFLREMLGTHNPSEAQLAWIEKIYGRISRL
jgi:excisionase family DNA binding protein